ncbi:MAG: LCP family protein [Candidatus Gastranaerophilales bacterium]|nr:LCP family protein [Candidatus Gastranaerophilales bacterium]
MAEEFNPEENQETEEVLPKRKKRVSKFLEENIEEKKQQHNMYFIAALIMSILLVSTGIFATYKYFQEDFEISLFDFDKQGKNKSDKDNLKVKGNLFNRKHNILILGVDSNGTDTDPFENTRSDTILIVTLKPKDKSVNIISIPRDSKVFLAHRNGVQKINAAHAIGGVKLTKDTIEETFGIKINNYIVFNTEGIVKFIDAIGGVPVYVEKDMVYHDWSGKLHIDLKKGTHMLSGKEAEGFLRYRKDALGDIGRTSRQQWFVRAVAERLKDPEVITKIPEALRIADEYVKSDLSLYQMAQYAAYAASIDLSKVETATMPGAPNKKGYISYWILDPEQCKDVISRMVYNKKPDVDADKLPVAGIMYTSENEKQATSIKNKLEEAGYTVNMVRQSKLPHQQVFGHTNLVTPQFMNKLKNTCPEIKEMQFVYDPTKIYCANSDFTIILSK